MGGPRTPLEYRLDFRQRLVWVRNSTGLTQPEFAKRIGVKFDVYAKYELVEEPRLPPANVIARILEETGFDPWWFITGQAPAQRPSQRLPYEPPMISPPVAKLPGPAAGGSSRERKRRSPKKKRR